MFISKKKVAPSDINSVITSSRQVITDNCNLDDIKNYKEQIKEKDKVISVLEKENENYKKRTNRNTRDTIWQDNLVKIFDDIETSYVWQFRWNINSESGKFIVISKGCEAITGFTPEEMMNNSDGCLMENILTDDEYEKYIKNLTGFLSGSKNASFQEYNLKNGKKVSVNVLLHEKTNHYIDFIGLTTNLPHKQQLDLILESSEDMIMIDSGTNKMIDYIENNKDTFAFIYNIDTIDVNKLKTLIPIEYTPQILYVSKAYKNLGFDEPPINDYVFNIASIESIEKFIKYILINPNWSSVLLEGKINNIPVESHISKMGDNILSMTRNITDRIKRHEAEKALAIQKIARIKDSEANSFIKHEVKNGLYSAIGQIESMKDMYINAIKSSDVYLPDFHSSIINKYNEILCELDCTLDTVLSETVAKDIINNEYIPKKKKVNLMDIINRIKGDKFKWYLNPKTFPNILIDDQLLFYILRNALSNANKYGKEWSDIKIILSIVNTKLKIIVENEPGEENEKLISLENHNIIFEKGVKLHDNIPLKSKSCISSGDGAWIMKMCAELSNGICNIEFTKEKTIFTYETIVEIILDNNDITNFKLSDNTFIYIIDDSQIQRRLLNIQMKKFKLNDELIKVYGNGKDEIVGLENILYNNIVNYSNHYHIIICDENLDYKVDSTLYYESGTDICEKLIRMLNKISSTRNYLTFIRSANDNKSDIEKYLTVCDDFIPKAAVSFNGLREIITKQWIKQFGIVKNNEIDYTYNNESREIINIFLNDIDDFINIKYKYCDWNSFWSDLHILKGTLSILGGITNTKSAITMIESLRNNNYNEDFNIQWQGLCDELKQIKIAIFDEECKLEFNEYIPNLF